MLGRCCYQCTEEYVREYAHSNNATEKGFVSSPQNYENPLLRGILQCEDHSILFPDP